MRARMLLPVLAVGLLLAPHLAAQDQDSVIAAFERGDYATVQQLHRSRAEQGDAAAQVALGELLTDGRFAPQDHAQAVQWFRKAAEQGNATGQAHLGYMYAEGLGVPKDEALALQWTRRSADQDNPRGQYLLAVLYESGTGVARDFGEMWKWLRKAAAQGYVPAFAGLGIAYADGIGVDRSDAEAVVWFRKAAEQGDRDGQFNLGVHYHSARGVPGDDAEAAAWFRKAADQGHVGAANNLGMAYASGRGVQKDYEAASRWFRAAAIEGHAAAQASLGLMYRDGLGVARNPREARVWLKRAANQGETRAREAIALMDAQAPVVAAQPSPPDPEQRPESAELSRRLDALLKAHEDALPALPPPDGARATIVREILAVPGVRERLLKQFESLQGREPPSQPFLAALSPQLREAVQHVVRSAYRPEPMVALFAHRLEEHLDADTLAAGLAWERGPLARRIRELYAAFEQPEKQAEFKVFVERFLAHQRGSTSLSPDDRRARDCEQADVLGGFSDAFHPAHEAFATGIITATALERSQPADQEAFALAITSLRPLMRGVLRQAELFNCLFVHRDLSDAEFGQRLEFLRSDAGGRYERGRSNALRDTALQRAGILSRALIEFVQEIRKQGKA